MKQKESRARVGSELRRTERPHQAVPVERLRAFSYSFIIAIIFIIFPIYFFFGGGLLASAFPPPEEGLG